MKRRNNSIRLLMKKYLHEEKIFCIMQPAIKCCSQLPPPLPCSLWDVYVHLYTLHTHTLLLKAFLKLEQVVSRRQTLLTWWPSTRRSDEHGTGTRQMDMDIHTGHDLGTGESKWHFRSLQNGMRPHSHWTLQTGLIIQNNIYTTHFAYFNCE